MITLKKDERTIRETSCEFEYNEDGAIKSASIRVLYYSPTTRESRERNDKLRELYEQAVKEKTVYYHYASDDLLERLHSLPDIINPENELPYPITKEFLESLDEKNIVAIDKAIKDDLNPKSKPVS
jgi:hypothetical protein